MGWGPSRLDSRAQLTFMASLRLVRALFRWSTAFFRKDTLQRVDTALGKGRTTEDRAMSLGSRGSSSTSLQSGNISLLVPLMPKVLWKLLSASRSNFCSWTQEAGQKTELTH
jgi:hypothetical protein